MKSFTSLLLFPFAVLYGFVAFLRNKLFDYKIIKSTKFNLPVISIGNISMGGTGKTPHIEYLIKILDNSYKIITLSRGYGRKTKGFYWVDQKTNSLIAGDEPVQYFSKFPKIGVAVDEKRVRGISHILKERPETDVILLDDAFQHRYVKPGISILLTDFYKPFFHDYVFPSGTLREMGSGMKRADIIIVTKCPKVLSPITRNSYEEKLKIRSHQKLYFSYVQYDELIPLNDFSKNISIQKISTVLVFAGIANPYPLTDYLKSISDNVESVIFRDHYQFKEKDILNIKEKYQRIFSKNKIIVTTEKDAMRLKDTVLIKNFVDLPLFYLPIEVKLYKKDKENFDKQIIEYVRKNRTNH